MSHLEAITTTQILQFDKVNQKRLISIHILSCTVKGGECDSLNQVDPDLCIKCINQNRDLIVGVKVRLSASVANDGANEEEAFRFVYLVTVDFVSTSNSMTCSDIWYKYHK